MGILTTNTKSGLASAIGSRSGAQEIENLLTAITVDAEGASGTSTATGGGKDDTVAIQAALTRASTTPGLNKTVIVPPGKFYRITRTITVPKNVNFICQCDGTIVYDGTANEPAIIVGETADYIFHRAIRINVVRATDSDWTSESSIGVQLLNPVNCELDFPLVQGFTIGIQWASYLAAAYNYGVKLGHILANKIGLDLHSFTSVGYVNENSFLGGRFTYTTGNNTGKSRIGVRFITEVGGVDIMNNNIFLFPTFELSSSQASPGTALAVSLTNAAVFNAFLFYRTENNTTPHLSNSGTGGRNFFWPAFTQIGSSPLPTDAMSWTGTYKSDVIMTPEGQLMMIKDSWNSGDILSKTTMRDTGSQFKNIHTIGGHWEVSGFNGTTTALVYDWPKVTTDGEFIVPTANTPGFAVIVDTRKVKRFIAKKTVNASVNSGGRFCVRCYDGHPRDGGAIITSGADLVRGMSSGADVTWTVGSFGGCYRQNADSDFDWFFTVADSVKYISLICENAAISSLTIATPDPYPIHTFPLHGVSDGIRRMDAVPDYGIYNAGDFVKNSARTSMASPDGWLCTVSSTANNFTSATFVPVHTSIILTGSKTFDWPSVADGAVANTTVTVTGADLGNFAIASFSGAVTANAFMVAMVTATDTVTVTLFNKTGAPLDLASDTLSVVVFK